MMSIRTISPSCRGWMGRSLDLRFLCKNRSRKFWSPVYKGTDPIDCCSFSASFDSASVDEVVHLRFGRFSMPSSVSSLLLNHLSINPVHEQIDQCKSFVSCFSRRGFFWSLLLLRTLFDGRSWQIAGYASLGFGLGVYLLEMVFIYNLMDIFKADFQLSFDCHSEEQILFGYS